MTSPVECALRGLVVAGLVATSPAVSGARARRDLQPQLAPLFRLPGLDRGVTAVHVEGACTGRVLYSRRADRPVNPASNVKLVAMAAVLGTLPPGWRYATAIHGASPDRRGRVHGALWVVGMGDPTLDPAALDGLVARLAARGVRVVMGDVWIGSEVRLARRWRTGFRGVVRGAAMPGARPEARLDPPRPGVHLEVAARTVPDAMDGVRVRRGPRPPGALGMTFRVLGRVGPGRVIELRWSAVDRDVATAVTLGRAFRRAGIRVLGRFRLRGPHRARPGRRSRLVLHESAPLSTLVARVNQHSDNRLADALVATAGRAVFGGRPELTRGVQVMKDWLRGAARVDLAQVVLDTGSGLSYRSRLTARQIVRVLRVGGGFTLRGRCRRPSPVARAFRDSLARPGLPGTLQFRFRHSPARAHLAAKTGTLTGIYALSGLLWRGKGQEPIAFAIVTNGVHSSLRFLIRLRQDQLVTALHEALTRRASRGPPG